MSLPDVMRIVPGSAIVWGEAGGAGVTHTMSLDALANNTARQGAYADLGASFEQTYMLMTMVDLGTTPTSNAAYDVYLANTHDQSMLPIGTGLADAVYNHLLLPALQPYPDLTGISATFENIVLECNPVLWTPRARYVAPILYNRLGQALRNRTPNSDSLSRVILVPLSTVLQDS